MAKATADSAPGGLFEHESLWMTKGEARMRFLGWLNDLAPQVASDLAGTPLEAYRRERLKLTLLKLSELRRFGARGAGVAAALEEWSRRWHLTADWVREAALRALVLWDRDSEALASRRWLMPARGGLALPQSPLFTVSGWRLMEESRRAFRARAIEALDLYLDAQERGARTAGFSRDRHPQDLDRALQRVVRHRVLGERHTEIARSERPRVSPRAVSDSVKRTTALLGLAPVRKKRGPGALLP